MLISEVSIHRNRVFAHFKPLFQIIGKQQLRFVNPSRCEILQNRTAQLLKLAFILSSNHILSFHPLLFSFIALLPIQNNIISLPVSRHIRKIVWELNNSCRDDIMKPYQSKIICFISVLHYSTAGVVQFLPPQKARRSRYGANRNQYRRRTVV